MYQVTGSRFLGVGEEGDTGQGRGIPQESDDIFWGGVIDIFIILTVVIVS